MQAPEIPGKKSRVLENLERNVMSNPVGGNLRQNVMGNNVGGKLRQNVMTGNKEVTNAVRRSPANVPRTPQNMGGAQVNRILRRIRS